MYARLVVFTLQLEIVKAIVIVDGYKNKKSFTQGGYQQTSQYVFLKNKVSDEGCRYRQFTHSTLKVYLRKHLSGFFQAHRKKLN